MHFIVNTMPETPLKNISTAYKYFTGAPSTFLDRLGGTSINSDGFSGKFGKLDDFTNRRTFESDMRNLLDNSGISLSTTGSGAGATTAKEFDYYYADLAKRYGMDMKTAYNEALANTSYQRAVADMQAAGLNPAVLFSASKASAAGNPYSSGGYTSASGNASKGNVPGWLYYGATALAQIIGSVASGSFNGGMAASSVVQNILKAANGK